MGNETAGHREVRYSVAVGSHKGAKRKAALLALGIPCGSTLIGGPMHGPIGSGCCTSSSFQIINKVAECNGLEAVRLPIKRYDLRMLATKKVYHHSERTFEKA